MALINKQDTNGSKGTLLKGEFGYDDYTAGGDTGRVYVGTGATNIALAKKSEVDLKLDSASYTAADVKTKLLTVDGSGSGIDADLLDGQQGSYYQQALVSGTSIKTINSTTVLGSGNIAVQPTLVSGTNIKTVNGVSVLGSGNISVSSELTDSVTTTSSTIGASATAVKTAYDKGDSAYNLANSKIGLTLVWSGNSFYITDFIQTYGVGNYLATLYDPEYGTMSTDIIRVDSTTLPTRSGTFSSIATMFTAYPTNSSTSSYSGDLRSAHYYIKKVWRIG